MAQDQVEVGESKLLRQLSEAQQAADRAEKRLRGAIDAFPEGIVFLDEDGRYVLWNAKYEEIYARSADLLKPGVRLADTLRIGVERGDYPQALGREEEWLEERLSLLANPGQRQEQWISSGRCIMIEERKTAGGDTIGLRVDITEMKQREESFRLLFESNPVPLLVYEPASQSIRSANRAAMAHFGYDDGSLLGMPARQLFADEDWGDAAALLTSESAEPNRFWCQRARDGSHLESLLYTRSAIFDGRPATIVSVFDVTERRRIEARMVHMARHDELTGLANRAHCRERLHELLDSPQREEVSVALIDLDHFKSINDSHGHSLGDALLANAAARMRILLPKSALLCRIGGDEFAAIFRSVRREQIELTLRSIGTAMSEPFFIGDHALRIGCTVGVAASPDDASDGETLLRFADLALYAGKGARRGSITWFDPAMDTAAREKAQLENDFREAVCRGKLAVHYQPLVNLGTGELDGYEALLRWNHPVRGQVSPDVFVPLAEEMGLIDVVGQFVLQTACRDAVRWPEPLKLAVNVSPVQFRSGNLLNVLLQALAASGLSSSRLELEITEAVLMDQEVQTADMIRRIRSLGIGISMDDSGTGYSSLNYLLRYPFTKIKIDKSFIMGFSDNAHSKAVIRAIIGLGQSLGLAITAEGIEHGEVLDYLRSEGCSQGQGYLFGKARPAEELFESAAAVAA